VQLADGDHSVHPSHRLVAPNSIRSEALDLLLQRVRGRTLTEQAALELHERITGVKMRLLGDRVSRRTAWQIARDRGWSTLTEAEYLAVAKLQADALITDNPDLVAKAKGIVPLAPFTDLLAD
jgi:predicted nucleic acid-binding protein